MKKLMSSDEIPFHNKEYPAIIGKSNTLNSVKEKIEKACNKNVAVLILGETGTGKELVANSIHLGSKRKKKKLVTVNCAALPNELLESELFGYCKGAFTGASHDKPGKFEDADQGTIFLDEITSLSPLLQSKILQILEDKKVSRLGSINDTPIDVRVIAATNSNLEKEIANGTFRNDLYYRLNVVSIVLPSLIERKEDIPLLVNYFMNKYFLKLKKKPVYLNDSHKKHLQEYYWPGNIRELENIIKRIAALQKPDIIYTDLKLKRAKESRETSGSDSSNLWQIWDDRKISAMISNKKHIPLKAIRGQYVAEVETMAISEALKLTSWNRKKAAKMLQISYKTILNKMDGHKIGLKTGG